ncbi:gliding motility-associated C-terminal domain-containing protein [Aquimarina pacifica]|uniref:gliding motility-associated C-terminal domain-containing protein n=1 Tax=Aquimarina pacifica TaxID=1296415 RepID=UPI00047107D3|nr:gliding motility-associated C-terminal domain-containing protein [Aquimarina pacifica]
METVDGDGDVSGNPDGIINIYDLTGTTVADGVWEIAPNYAIAFDESTGDMSLWALQNSTTIATANDYSFELLNTAVCGTDPVRTATLNLGAFSGVALPRTGTLNVNASGCDAEGFDLFTAFLQDDQIPPPHQNGTWSYNGSSPNFLGFGEEKDGLESTFYASIPYQEGLPRVDQEVFEFTYTVPGLGPCDASRETTVRIAMVRQVSAGGGSGTDICENDIQAGLYDTDIDLRDDLYLQGEDSEGIWLYELDPTGQLSNASDSNINIKELYDNVIDGGNNLRFGCESFEFFYSVEQRSGVCLNDTTSVNISFYEQLRPFSQTVAPPIICANESPGDFNLFSLLEFTTEGITDFVYTDEKYVNWRLVSGPSDLGLQTLESYYPIPPNVIPDDFHLGAINTFYQIPGTYVFEYAVSPKINCQEGEILCNPFDSPGDFFYCEHPCAVETGLVTIEVVGFDSAGIDTEGINLCEIDGQVDLRSLLLPNGAFPIATTGVWTDSGGAIIDNVFIFPDSDTEQTFTFTYSTSTVNGCVDSADLTFTINKEVYAGEDASVTLCSDDLTVTLFDLLGGDPDTTGLWTGPFAYESTDHLGVFDATDELLPIIGSGTYTYTVPGNSGCTSIDDATVTVSIVDPIEIGEDVNETFCKIDGRVNLYSLLDRDTVRTGFFEDTDDTGALNEEGVLEFETLTNEIYTFRYVVSNALPCDESSLLVAVQIVDIPSPVLPEQEFCILDAKRLEDIEVDVLNYNWYDQLESENPIIDNPILLNNQIYYIASVDANNCESERVEVLIKILNTGERFSNGDLCTMDFQDGVSPNGDNQNDSFALQIDDLFNIPEAFPDFDLKIYNRYGSLVYDANINTEEFRGESNVSLRLGDDLPSGTYFYIFNPNFENNLPIQGSFYLSR